MVTILDYCPHMLQSKPDNQETMTNLDFIDCNLTIGGWSAPIPGNKLSVDETLESLIMPT